MSADRWLRMADTEGSVDHEIKYKFHFTKRGPEPSEFYDSLTSKMDGFIRTIDLNESEKKSIKEANKRAMCIVKKRVCIRQNITNPAKLDGRRSANQHHTKKGMLRNPYESPQKAAEDSRGQRGVVKYTKKIHSDYKKKQITLMNYLKCFFGNNKTCDPRSSTEEFCNYIDQHTLSIIKLLVDGVTSVKLEILSTMLDLCEHVIMGRIDADWAQPNDLITTSGWNNWRKHMCVLMSFAAMLTTLFMAFSTLKRSLVVVTYNSCIGIFPVVVVTGFIHTSYYISCKHHVLYMVHAFPKTCYCTI